MNAKTLVIQKIKKACLLAKIIILSIIAYCSYLVATCSEKLSGFDGLMETAVVPAAQTVPELLYEYTIGVALIVGTFLHPLVVILYVLLVKSYGKVLSLKSQLGSSDWVLPDSPDPEWLLMAQQFVFSSVFFAQILNSSLYLALVINSGGSPDIETLMTFSFMLLMLLGCTPLYLMGLKPLTAHWARVRGVSRDKAIIGEHSVRNSVMIASIGLVMSGLRWGRELIDFLTNLPFSLFEELASYINVLLTLKELL
ncbi:hypothetical protein ACQKQC_05755 [Vibrio fortis]|uniref:hypothetical protein n=1 Tax=Vibrio fortis TaxID=212667 RepID=UPI00406919A5